jgi:hypothetical protein
MANMLNEYFGSVFTKDLSNTANNSHFTLSEAKADNHANDCQQTLLYNALQG